MQCLSVHIVCTILTSEQYQSIHEAQYCLSMPLLESGPWECKKMDCVLERLTGDVRERLLQALRNQLARLQGQEGPTGKSHVLLTLAGRTTGSRHPWRLPSSASPWPQPQATCLLIFIANKCCTPYSNVILTRKLTRRTLAGWFTGCACFG